METEYKKVPDIITGKDLSYLTDIFNWNYYGYKMIEEALNNVEDKNINSLLKECSNEFYNSLNTILDILYEKGDNFEE